MPGVNVRTATRSGPVNVEVPPAGRYFVTGLTEYGRTDVGQRVRSMAEYELLYGGRVSYGSVYDDLRTFFEEGGTEAYVGRVVGGAATKATVTLKDQAADPGVNTIRIDAIAAGSAYANTSVAVEVDVSGADTVDLTVNGPIGSGGPGVRDSETYRGLATVAEVVAALADSQYVRAVNLGSATAAPNNLPRAGTSNLVGGTDDRAAVTYVDLGNAHGDLFGPELGAGAMAIPGVSGPPSAIWEESTLRDTAQECRRLFLGAAPVGSTDEEYVDLAETFVTEWGNTGEFVGLFGPWVRIPIGGGATKLVSPEGYVAACRARAIREGGPWIAPAGERSIARFVLGTERDINRAAGDTLDAAGVSAIRTIAGTTRLYGWRSLSNDEANYALLTGRDVLNVVAVEAEVRLERYVFSTIDSDGRLYASVAGELIGILDPLRMAGGLYARYSEDGSTQLDPGYSVDVGPTVNTIAVQQAGTVAAVVALRVSPVGTLIDVTIVKAGLTATV